MSDVNNQAVNGGARISQSGPVNQPTGLGDADSKKLLDYSRSMIYYAVVNHKNDIINILNKNGIAVPANVSTKALHFIVLEAMIKSISFKNDLTNVLSQLASGNGNVPPVINTQAVSQASPENENNASSSGTGSTVNENFTGSKNQTGWNTVTGNLDCGVKNNNSQYNSFSVSADKYANQDGTTTTSDNFSASGLTTSSLVQQGLNLAVAYYASQGSKAVGSDVNNAAAQAQAQAAQAQANTQLNNFEIVVAVIMVAAICYAGYRLTKRKAV